MGIFASNPQSELWMVTQLPSSVEEGCLKGGVVLSKPPMDLLTSTTPSAPASDAFGGIFFVAQPPLLS